MDSGTQHKCHYILCHIYILQEELLEITTTMIDLNQDITQDYIYLILHSL